MGAFDEGGADLLNAGDYRGSFSGAPLADTSWTAQMPPNAGGAGGGGGFWSGLSDAASKVWGASGTKDATGSGVLGALDDFGKVAKTVMPVAQIAGGIGSFIAQRDAMDQLKRRGTLQDQANRSVMENVNAARPLAAEASNVAGDIRSTAAKVDPLAAGAAEIPGQLRAMNSAFQTGNIDQVQSYAAERLARAQRGEIPPAIQAQIDTWKTGALQVARDRLARSGQGDSSSLDSLESSIDQMAKGMAAKFLQDEEKQALAAFDQARAGVATAGAMYGTEGAQYGNAANIYGSEVNDQARAGEVLGIGGNILSNAGRTAGGVAGAQQNDAAQIAQLIAAAQQELSRLTGSQK